MGNCGVECDWRLGLEGIRVVTDGIGGESSAGIVGGLSLRRVWVARNPRLGHGGGVRDILTLASRNVGRDETHRDGTLGGDAQAIQRKAVSVHKRGAHRSEERR